MLLMEIRKVGLFLKQGQSFGFLSCLAPFTLFTLLVTSVNLYTSIGATVAQLVGQLAVVYKLQGWWYDVIMF